MGASFETLKFQALGLGYSIFMLLPILGVLAAISASELTDWSIDGGVPRYNANYFYSCMFALIVGGYVGLHTAGTASFDPRVVPWEGSKIAVFVTLPCVTSSSLIMMVLCIALPNISGVDVHFFHLDVLGFLLLALSGSLVGETSKRWAAPLIQPQFYDFDVATLSDPDDRSASSLTGRIMFLLCIVVVAVIYPLAIVPVYNGAFDDTGRLLYCLLVHPLLLEFILYKCRNRAAEEYSGRLRDRGLPESTIDEQLLQCSTRTPFLVEAILVFNRRFMIGLMSNPTAATFAIVLTAVQEVATRATMIDRDDLFHRMAGRQEPTHEELEKQRLIWTMQSGNSMIIETTAIMIHAASVYFFLPHRFIFNFGYGATESEGAALTVIIMSTLLELVGEVITDHISILVEKAHGVQVERYFCLLKTSAVGIHHCATMFGATGLVLWTFSRVPSVTFCGDTNPCSCLDMNVAQEDESGTNFEIYREICACQPVHLNDTNTSLANASTPACANATSDASTRFASSTSDIDSGFLMQLGFALSAVLATSMLVYASISVVKRRRAQAKVDAAETMLDEKDAIIGAKSRVIEVKNDELARLVSAKRSLELRFLPTTEEEKLFRPFRKKLQSIVGEAFLESSEFSFVRKIGIGAFGEVHLAEWRRRGFDEVIEVAVKSLHGDKLSSARHLDSLLSEIQNLHSLSHPRVVRFYGIIWPEKALPGIVMEYMMNGSLSDLLHGTAKDEAFPVAWLDPLLKIATDVAEGMRYLHERSYIHRDLKPENALMTRTFGGKLADLGEARVMDLNMTMTMTGTPFYCKRTLFCGAPEVLLGENYTELVDVYSYGITLNEMDTQQVPYRDEHSKSSKFHPIHVMESGLRPSIRTECPELRALIEDCWCQDPESRPKASEILRRLQAHSSSFDSGRDGWLSPLLKKKRGNSETPALQREHVHRPAPKDEEESIGGGAADSFIHEE